MEQENKRKPRRTKKDLENTIETSAIKVIADVGFSGLTVAKLLKETKAEPPVFYNRYKDISDFIDKFVRMYDYWLNDSIKIDFKEGNALKNIENIIINLVDLIDGNVCMQKLIAWELNESNFITRRTAQNRDTNSYALIKYFEDEFKDCDINFNAALGIIIGGIYYLIIHKNLSTFNNIDYTKSESMDLLKNNIRLIIRKIFEDYKSKAI